VAPPDPELLARALIALGPGRVGDLRRLSGGASRETWSFDLVVEGGPTLALVLRRDPGTVAGWSERSTEYALLAAAGAAGVPVPAVRHLLRPEDGIGEGFVMDRIDGETIPRRILRDDDFASAREHLAGQCGRIAARIHAVDPGGLPHLPVQDGAAQVAFYRNALDTFGEPHPAFELGLRWLDRHAPPPPATPVLVHGDLRNGNFIVGPEGIRAVLDWELSHLGDPVEDLGWLCVRAWRFGIDERLVGGFGDLPDLLAAYTAAGGAPVAEDTLRWWVALGTLKWGIICMSQAFTHLGGAYRSVELAAIGRRVAQTEWDLLDLIEGGW